MLVSIALVRMLCLLSDTVRSCNARSSHMSSSCNNNGTITVKHPVHYFIPVNIYPGSNQAETFEFVFGRESHIFAIRKLRYLTESDAGGALSLYAN